MPFTHREKKTTCKSLWLTRLHCSVGAVPPSSGTTCQGSLPSLYLAAVRLLYCRGDVWVQCVYFVSCEGWKESKLFDAPDLLMKNQTGLSRLLFLVNFVNVEWQPLVEEAASVPATSFFILTIISIMILLYFSKPVLLIFLWKCERWPFV